MTSPSFLAGGQAAAAAANQTLLVKTIAGTGQGVVAGRRFAEGEDVLEFIGERVARTALDDLTHALQIGPTRYIAPSGELNDFVNHSCEPNCGIRDTADGRVVLFALRPVGKDEQITFDYSTTQSGGHWPLACACQAASCRGDIGDFADLPRARQDYYRARNAVLDYLK